MLVQPNAMVLFLYASISAAYDCIFSSSSHLSIFCSRRKSVQMRNSIIRQGDTRIFFSNHNMHGCFERNIRFGNGRWENSKHFVGSLVTTNMNPARLAKVSNVCPSAIIAKARIKQTGPSYVGFCHQKSTDIRRCMSFLAVGTMAIHNPKTFCRNFCRVSDFATNTTARNRLFTCCCCCCCCFCHNIEIMLSR